MTLPFRKMHGLGNDFVIVDARTTPLAVPPALIRAACDRHWGVGCDQFVVLEPPPADSAAAETPLADLFVRFYNGDGSEAGACGNATRCVASLVMAERGSDRVVVQTIAGRLPAWRQDDGRIAVAMGRPKLDWQDIPLARAADTLAVPLEIGGLSAPVAVNMGNPHAVFFVPDAEAVPLSELGPRIETAPIFPDRTNVEICQVLAPDRLRMRVWERGAGITLACGSGACAAVVAAVRRGLTGRRVTVVLDGGPLEIDWRESDDILVMTGPVATSFTGTLDPGLVAASG